MANKRANLEAASLFAPKPRRFTREINELPASPPSQDEGPYEFNGVIPPPPLTRPGARIPSSRRPTTSMEESTEKRRKVKPAEDAKGPLINMDYLGKVRLKKTYRPPVPQERMEEEDPRPSWVRERRKPRIRKSVRVTDEKDE